MAAKTNSPTPIIRCAIYTRKSTEEGLDQQFNSLDAQHESSEAFIRSQQLEGWRINAERYDDGGYSGGNTERPAFKRLMEDKRPTIWMQPFVPAIRRSTKHHRSSAARRFKLVVFHERVMAIKLLQHALSEQFPASVR